LRWPGSSCARRRPRRSSSAPAPPAGPTIISANARDKLAQDGIEVELRPSSGAVENLRRLKTDDSVDVGFMQGGIANEPESEDLATLGSMYLEPVWVFHRGDAHSTASTS
jgi:TRAP-type uncharacterized transport system substrate-binding protein